jgi:NADH dehydrogenase
MATITRFHAVVSVKNIRITGFIAWMMWLALHVAYLVGFKNRFTTMVHWLVSFGLRGRSQRTTTRQQTVGRLALARLDSERAARQQQSADTPAPAEDSQTA